MTMNISAYSLVAVTNRARPMMPNGGSILTLTYYGAEKVVPHYNVMGVAKAALETSVKYLANDLGPGEHPRQRDQRRADQDARGERDRRLPLHPQVERDQRAAAAQRHDRGRRRARAVHAERPLERVTGEVPPRRCRLPRRRHEAGRRAGHFSRLTVLFPLCSDIGSSRAGE
jgi:hypothetical protein